MKRTAGEDEIKQEKEHDKERVEGLNRLADQEIEIWSNIGDLRKRLEESLKAGDNAEAQRYADRIAVLEKEKILLDQIAENMILVAELGGKEGISNWANNATPMQIGGTTGEPVTEDNYTTADRGGSGLPAAVQSEKEVTTLKQAQLTLVNAMGKLDKERYDNLKKEYKLDDENLKKQYETRLEIIKATGDLIMQLSQVAGLDQQSSEVIAGMVNTLGQAASGDVVGAVAGVLSTVMSAASDMFSKTEPWIESQSDIIKDQLKEQERNIELAKNAGGLVPALQAKIEGLNTQLKFNQDTLNILIDRFTKEGHGELQLNANIIDYWKKQIQDTANLLIDANQQLDEALAGNATQSSIADAISQGFQDGKKSAEDFADTFQNFMTTAINSSLEDMSKPAISEWYAKFAEDMASGGGLTDAEKADLKAQWDKIIAEGEANRQAAYQAAGINPDANIGSPQALSGQIETKITEDTGTELAGLMRRIADDNGINKDYNKSAVDHLIAIEMNTFIMVDHLQEAVANLDVIKENTKPVYAKDLG